MIHLGICGTWDLTFEAHGIEFVAHGIEIVAHGFHVPQMALVACYQKLVMYHKLI
jgi:hypothetical protein